MGNGRHSRFGKELRQCDAEREMHGDGKTVLRNENIDIELIYELIDRAFEIISHRAYSLGYEPVPAAFAPNPFIDPNVLGEAKVRFRHDMTYFWGSVALSTVPITHVPVFPKHFGPLGALERNPILPREPG